jgi:hypothetical protein
MERAGLSSMPSGGARRELETAEIGWAFSPYAGFSVSCTASASVATINNTPDNISILI